MPLISWRFQSFCPSPSLTIMNVMQLVRFHFGAFGASPFQVRDNTLHYNRTLGAKCESLSLSLALAAMVCFPFSFNSNLNKLPPLWPTHPSPTLLHSIIISCASVFVRVTCAGASPLIYTHIHIRAHICHMGILHTDTLTHTRTHYFSVYVQEWRFYLDVNEINPPPELEGRSTLASLCEMSVRLELYAHAFFSRISYEHFSLYAPQSENAMNLCLYVCV